LRSKSRRKLGRVLVIERESPPDCDQRDAELLGEPGVALVAVDDQAFGPNSGISWNGHAGKPTRDLLDGRAICPLHWLLHHPLAVPLQEVDLRPRIRKYGVCPTHT
jgi:hypothetical protein